jgi:hypothetical protein
MREVIVGFTNDQKTTISGAVIAIGAAIAIFFPQAGSLIQQIASAIAIVAIAFLGYWSNKK